MNKDSLKYVLREFTERELPRTHPRALMVPIHAGKVITLVGIRRSGKTFLMFHTMRGLVERGVDRSRMIYLNFEDDRLFPIAPADLDHILRAHSELYPETAHNGPRYLFLDEVQAVPGWERYVRRIHDTGGTHLVVTGSSSRALTRDLAPALRGRSISLEVFPLSFPEYLEFRGLSYRPFDTTSEAVIVNALEAYLSWGGLPELVLAEESLRPLIIEEYMALLFHRDIVDRYSIRNERVMRLLLKYCCSNPASLLSVHRLFGDFRSQGLSVSKNTLYEYLECLEDAMVLFLVPRHDKSLRKQEQNPRKVHLVDTALSRVFRVRPEEDVGHRLENLIFLHERRKGKHIYYLANSHQVDFFVEGPEAQKLINVAWALGDSSTLRREEAALEWGLGQKPGAEAWLVAHDVTGSLKMRQDFRTTPAWRYLLGVPSGA